MAELFDMGFNGFEQETGQIVAYIAKEKMGVGDREHIEQLLAGFPGNGFIASEEIVKDQNWNQQWEATIQGQEIGRFFVKPTWDTSATPDDKILLEIDPKMSFGTGYHETTRLILQLLPEIIQPGDTLVDAGTGTGILSIAAIKLGAGHALAFDIDEWSVKNTAENILLNEVSEAITIRQGSAEVLSGTPNVDVILANIERNVILELLPDFLKVLKCGGTLVLSGLLETDKQDVLAALSNVAEDIGITQENEWIAVTATINQTL